MKLRTTILFAMFFASSAFAQQPQAPANTPVADLNAKYSQGSGTGYTPTKGSGLVLHLGGGTVVCSGTTPTFYAAGTLTLTNSTTNYVYLNTISSCAPESNTTGFTTATIPIAIVVTSGGLITTITDVRSPFNGGTGGGGGGSPGGSTTQLQFNDVGTFGGSTGWTYDKTLHVLGGATPPSRDATLNLGDRASLTTSQWSLYGGVSQSSLSANMQGITTKSQFSFVVLNQANKPLGSTFIHQGDTSLLGGNSLNGLFAQADDALGADCANCIETVGLSGNALAEGSHNHTDTDPDKGLQGVRGQALYAGTATWSWLESHYADAPIVLTGGTVTNWCGFCVNNYDFYVTTGIVAPTNTFGIYIKNQGSSANHYALWNAGGKIHLDDLTASLNLCLDSGKNITTSGCTVGGSGTVNSGTQHQLAFYNTSTNAVNGLTLPADTQTYILSGSSTSDPAWALPGQVINAQTGTSYTWLTGDRGKVITQSSSSASAYTLPQAGSTGFTNNFYGALFNRNTGLATITTTTSTINGASTQIVPNNWVGYIYSDNTNYFSPVLPTIAAFPNCTDATGNHLNFTAATGAFSCGTSSSRRSCDIPVGDTTGSALTNGQLGPQAHVCKIPSAATVIEIDVDADAGSPSVIVGRRRCTTFTAGTCSAETTVNLLSGALAVSSGFEKCSNTGGTTGLDGGTTCSSTLQNTSLNAGDWIELVSGTAGGTAKFFVVHIVYTVN